MAFSRLLALAGVVIGIIGLAVKSLSTSGEELLPQLSQASEAFPDGIPTIWGGLDTWAQILLVVLIIVVVVLALRPPLDQAMDTMSASVVSVIGFALMVYAIIKWMDAADKADNLQAGFAEAFAGGLIPEAYTVNTTAGFLILVIGTVVVIFSGIVAITANQSKDKTAAA